MIGILSNIHWYALDGLVASARLPLGAIDTEALKIPHCTNEYALPPVTEGDAALIEVAWLDSVEKSGGDVTIQVLEPLRKRFKRLIGLEHSGSIQLHSRRFVPHLDLLLKNGGVYRDRDLYNFEVGLATPKGRWTEKVVPHPIPLSSAELHKIRYCMNSLVFRSPSFRGLVRPLYSSSRIRRVISEIGERLFLKVPLEEPRKTAPAATAHFVGSLSHVQRVDAVRLLKRSKLKTISGITGINSCVAGLKGSLFHPLNQEERAQLNTELRRDGLTTHHMNLFEYFRSLRRAKAVVSIAGHGEICFRMAEAWQAGRVLVCQDMSHADTGFPFEHGKNVIFCRPDLSDLLEILEDIECNYPAYRAIAEQGFHDWNAWCLSPSDMVANAFKPLTAP